MSNTLVNRKGFKGIIFTFFALSLLLSCNQTNMNSRTAAENFVNQYLKDRYSMDFELISLRRENARGDKVRNYVAQFRSPSHDRRNFYVTFSGNDSYKISKDEFPIILLEQAFLENLDIENYKDFPVVFEVEGKFVKDVYLDGINNLKDAKAKLGSIGESSWLFLIYTIIEDPEKRITEIEDMVINLLRQAYKILPTEGSADVYIYKDATLSVADLQPDMNKGIVNRTPNASKVYEEWIMGWTPSKLKNYANEFQSVVKKREVIPQ